MSRIKVNKNKMKILKEEADNKRQWHPNFILYTESIVKHSNYKGLFFERGADGRVKWVVAGKSEKGLLRRSWWDEQCKINNIKIEAGCYQKIALKIHPTKKHTCQICGKELSIEYIYPNKRTIDSIKKEFGITVAPYTEDIFQIVARLANSQEGIEKVKRIFKITPIKLVSVAELNEHLKKYFVDCFAKGLLSPGAMSNSPDRFDGFHSDGACHRHESDKGRHKSNLQRYGQDRRVYENWADGDWKKADRLMSLFRKHGVSADHIGPISLGFSHRPKFQPLTAQQNSEKNNRMSFSDVKILLNDEINGEQIVSWHSKYIWDILKGKVKNDTDAIKLSSLMRKNLHYILTVFSMIDEKGYGKFLENYLNPGFSFFDHTFEGFDPKTGSYKNVISKKLSGKNQKNNIERYYRVAFDELQEYKKIENRRTNIWKNTAIDNELNKLYALLRVGKNDEAKAKLKNIFELFAVMAEQEW
jgi:Alw26I/Eco31I/Esp3I family type II restriction endonuclease